MQVTLSLETHVSLYESNEMCYFPAVIHLKLRLSTQLAEGYARKFFIRPFSPCDILFHIAHLRRSSSSAYAPQYSGVGQR